MPARSRMVRRRRATLAAWLLGSLALLGCEEAAGPGSFAAVFTWDVAPTEAVHAWVRVEHRPDGALRGPIQASAGPLRWAPGETTEVTLDGVPHGADKVLVVEVRAAANEGLRVLWYGASAPFALQAGEHVTVEVPVRFQQPAADRQAVSVVLAFDGVEAAVVRPEQARAATVAVAAKGAVEVVLANDAGFSANLTTVSLVSDGERVTCAERPDPDAPEAPWTVCHIPGWDLDAGLPPDLGDGLRRVYVRLVDAAGYESAVTSAAVLVDGSGPQVVSAALSAEIAARDSVVALSVTTSEPLGDPARDARLLVTAAGPLAKAGDGAPPPLEFGPPERQGDSTTYVWRAPILPEHDGLTFTFQVVLTDAQGNTSVEQTLTLEGGAPLALLVDTEAPALAGPATLSPADRAIALQGDPHVRATFALVEATPPLSDLACAAGCPEVRLDGAVVGAVTPWPAGDDPDSDALGFAWDADVTPAEWGAIEGALPLTVHWTDAAGNSLSALLGAAVAVDFVRPAAADCALAPEVAGGGDTLLYRVTASEALGAAPTLTVAGPEPALFETATARPVGDRAWQWSRPAAGLADQAYTIRAVLVDAAGNASEGPVCELAGRIDTTPPALVAAALAPADHVFALPAAGAAPERAALTFALAEAAPPALGADCATGCPEVRVAGVSLGAVRRAPAGDDPPAGVLGFTWEAEIGPAEWGAIEGGLPLTVQWTDAAGNGVFAAAGVAVPVDFVRPTAADCLLAPEVAGGNDTLTYRVTASEALGAAPTLTVSGPAPALFETTTAQPTGDRAWQWSRPAAGLADQAYTVRAVLVDAAGNASEGPVCEQAGRIDTTPPALVAAALEPVDHVFALPEAGAAPERATLTFALAEAAPPALGADCATGCPEVRLSGVSLGAVRRAPGGDDPPAGVLGFTWEAEIRPAEWGAVEGGLPLTVQWTDAAGNGVFAPAGVAVPVDFVRPTAADCQLAPAAAVGSDLISYRITATEALADVPALTVAGPDPGLFDAATVTRVGDRAVQWQRPAAGLPDQSYTVHAVLVDAAGNASEGPVCERAGLIDALAPRLVDAAVATEPAVAGPAGTVVLGVRDGSRLRATVTVEDAGALDVDAVRVLLEAPTPVSLGPPAGGPACAPLPVAAADRWRCTFEAGFDAERDAALAGTWPLRLTAADTAGNPLSAGDLAGARVLVDFTAPGATCELTPAGRAVRADESVRLVVAVDEPLAPDFPRATLAGGPVAFGAAETQGLTTTWTAPAPAVEVDDDWTWQVDLRDRAGNEVLAVCGGNGRHDASVPTLGEPLDVTPRRATVGDSVRVRLTVDEAIAVAGLTASLEGRAMGCTADGGGAVDTAFTCTWPLVAADIAEGREETWTVLVTVADAADNRDSASASLVVDRRPPAVAVASVSYAVGPDNPLGTVTAATLGTTIYVSLVADEELDTTVTPTLTAEGGGAIDFAVVPDTLGAGGVTFRGTVPDVPEAERAALDGTYTFTVTWADTAGNLGEDVAVTGAAAEVEASRPELLVDQEAVTWHRSPWGNAAPMDLGDHVLPAGPLFELAPGDPLDPSPVLPAATFGLSPARTLEELYVWGDEDATNLLGRLRPDDAGDWPRQALVPLDVPAVWLTGIDDAGNDTGPVPVEYGEWVATPNPPRAGDSPHRLTSTVNVVGSLSQPADLAQEAEGSAAAAADDDAVHVSAAPLWSQLDAVMAAPPPPTPSNSAPAVYDARRGVMVVVYREGDTWEWDGLAWRDATPVHQVLPVRADRSLAWDGRRGRVIAFGGARTTGSSFVYGDVSEWDGTAWRAIAVEGATPSARQKAAMAYDTARGVVLLFGGRTAAGELLDDTWEWDGLRWIERHPETSPGPREDAVLGDDPTTGRLVLFGGVTDPAADNQDAWEWNGDDWTLLSLTVGGGNRALHAGRWSVAGGTSETGLILVRDDCTAARWGGTTLGYLGAQAGFNTYTDSCQSVWDGARGEFVSLVLRRATTNVSETWTWTLSPVVRQRRTTTAARPNPTWGHSVAWNPWLHGLVVYGGQTWEYPYEYPRETWTWSWQGWSLRQATAGDLPPGVLGASLVWVPEQSALALYGGQQIVTEGGGQSSNNQLWIWRDQGDTRTWQRYADGPATSGHRGFAYDEIRRRFVWLRYFPRDGDCSPVEVHETAGGTWTNPWNGLLPSSCFEPWSATWDEAAGAVVALDRWGALAQWDGSNWEVRSLAEYGAGYIHQLAYDAARDRLWGVAFPYNAPNTPPAGAYSDGVRWYRTGAPARYPDGPVCAWDPDGARLLCYGDGEVWAWAPDPDRSPAVQFVASAGAADMAAEDVTAIRVRARCGGTFAPFAPEDTGALLVGWASGGPGRQPGEWVPLDGNEWGVTTGVPAVPADPVPLTWTAEDEEARRFLTVSDPELAFQCRAAGGSGEGNLYGREAEVALDWIEVRVRYQTAP